MWAGQDGAGHGQLWVSSGIQLAPYAQLDPAGTGTITRAAFAASQVDWRHLQANHKDQWVALAQEVFSSLDVDHDGVLRVDEIMNHLTQVRERGPWVFRLECSLALILALGR